MARENVFTNKGNLSAGGTATIIASGDSGRYQITSLHFDTTSAAPVLALVIGGTTAVQTVAPSYTVDLTDLWIDGESCTITATGGAGTANYAISVMRK